MNQPTTQPSGRHHRFSMLSRFMRRPLGLPPFEALFGALFFVGVLAALTLVIWNAYAIGPLWQ
ncbi:MAG TPA: hypothetical protein VIK18_09050 [Pirellulales bacterium]